MADNEQKAMQLVADAEKKLKSAQGFLGGLFRSSSKIEEACEMYTKAANMFKMAKKWSAAGSAFSEAANLRLKMDNRHDAAACLIDAGNCYKKADAHGDEVPCNSHVYRVKLKAMQHYEQAADFFRGEESNSSANKCMLSVAKYAAQLEQYEKAINIYEQVGEASLASPLMKYSAKEYYFCAALLHTCVDVLNAQHAIKKYEEICPSFHDSRECKFVLTLLEKLEEQDVDGFTDAVKEYDSISRLDSWYTNILLRIKKTISENPDLC
ncbi:alpha-soluble NSF attachment protein [Trichonephila inaurata madagascariensis]|uniref:Alpha-soluble NSF attachment protein n=1 Tax=Trichonephila inaurata madagascariensis TaxID=2747483 RepID=A0A8X7CMU3_9ARAC|nr:alpha-soluble NSF attachment protein [Trichonephila inaurata madagascariensis]